MSPTHALAIALALSASACAVSTPLQPPASSDLRLITFTDRESDAMWLSPAEVAARVGAGQWVGWMDLTDHPHSAFDTIDDVSLATNHIAFPAAPAHPALVHPAIAAIDPARINATIASLQDFLNRFHNSDYGRQAAEWVYASAEQIVQDTGVDAVVELYHHDWVQASVIVTWAGEDDELVVLASHIDSTVILGDRAPGADDDASGTAVALEAFRALASTGFKPKRTIQLTLHAAEEVGLRGSADLANDYAAQGVEVYAVLNSEMCGYPSPDPHVALIDDTLTDKPFVDFIALLIDEYLDIHAEFDACNSGCADHASWTRAGYASTTMAEAGPSSAYLNPNYHRATDLLEFLDMEYASEFAKLAAAFMVEASLA